MGEVDLHAWFQRDELETCRACGETAAIRLPNARSFLCLVCGSVEAAEDDAEIDSPGRWQEHS
jgi:hypothetical protein